MYTTVNMTSTATVWKSWWRGIFGVPVRRELKEFYWFSGLFSFAQALVLIFEPVFFYQAGFSLAQIAVYYGLHYVLYLLLLPLGGKFAARFGLERSLTLSLPLFMAYFLTLAATQTYLSLFWGAWIVLALFKIFYWPAYYAQYSRYGNELNQGTEISFGYVLNLGVGVLGPLIGGVVATQFGFPVLFIAVALIGLCAAVPLLTTPERYTREDFPYTRPWRVIASRSNRRLVLGTIGWVEDLVQLVFWPVFAFLTLKTADVLGVVAGTSVFFMSLLAFFIGEWMDRTSPHKVLRWAVPFMSVVYGLRLFATTVPRVFFVHALALCADVSLKIPFWGKLYADARRKGVLRHTVAFEMVLSAAKATAALVLAGVFFFWGTSAGFTAAFLGAAVFAWFYRKF